MKKRILSMLLSLALVFGVLANCGTPVDAAVQLYWPVPGHTRLSQGYHDSKAIDISDGNIAGAQVIAAIGGTVTHIYLCGSQHYGSMHDCNGFGTGLVIAGDDGRIYQYAHMQAGSIPSNVYHGARVSSGQMIGRVGTTGNSSGNHLHFGISIGNYWNNSGINPQNESYIYSNPQLTASWESWTDGVTNTNATIRAKVTVNNSASFTMTGAYIWDPNGNIIAQPSEVPKAYPTYMNVWYDINSELGVTLKPGTKYTYQFWATINGQTFKSNVASFTTTGNTPITSVTLSQTKADLDVGESVTLTASVQPTYANNKTITWSSSNTSVATVTNGVVKAVAPGTATITARSHDGRSTSCTVNVSAKVLPVTGVKIGGRAGDALRINWTKNADAAGYIIEQYKSGKWVRIARIANNATTTYRVEKLSPATTYKFRIKAFDFEGSEAVYSDYTSISGKTNPSVMTGVKIGGKAGDALRINWTKNPTAAGYIIEQYKSGKWVRIARISGNTTTTYRVEKLSPWTTYKFRIQAFNYDGSTAIYGGYANVSGKTNPSVVAGVKISGRAADALRINWNRNTTAAGYIIEQYKSGKWVRVARIGDYAVTTYRVGKLSPSTSYKFRIQSFNFDGDTPVYSSYVYVNGKTNPSAMTGVKIGGKAKDALRINWTKNSSAAGYIIEQYKNGSWIRIARISGNATTTYRVENLRSSTTYKFRIQAFNMEGSTALYGSYAYINGQTLK